MRNGFLIYEKMRKYFSIYEEAVSLWLCNWFWISLYMRKIWFSFLSVYCISLSSFYSKLLPQKMCAFLKETVSRVGFLNQQQMFSRSFKSFPPPYTIINFLFVSSKLLTHFEYWNPPQNSLLCDWSMFPVPTSHWLQGKCARLTCHRRLPVWFYRITGGFL